MTKSPTPEQPTQEFLDLKRTYGPSIAKTVLRSLVQTPNPTDCLDRLSKRLPDIALAIIPTENLLSTEAKEVILGGTMALGSSLMMWGGMALAGQPWIPAIGCFLGSLGIVRMFTGVSHFKNSRHRFEFLKTYFGSLLALAKADLCFSDQERRQLEIILSNLELAPEDKNKLIDLKAPTVESLEIPVTLDSDQKKTILTGGFGLLYCDGVTTEELAAFNVLAERMGVTEPELEKIKITATKAIDEQDDLLTILGTVGDVLIPKEFQEKALDTLLQLASKKESKNALKRAIKSCRAADESEEYELIEYKYLETALFGAWFLGKCTVEPNPDALETLDKSFIRCCHETRKDSEGDLFKAKAAPFYDALLAEVIKQHKLALKIKTQGKKPA